MYLAVMLGLVPVGQLILTFSAKFFRGRARCSRLFNYCNGINGPVRLFVL